VLKITKKNIPIQKSSAEDYKEKYPNGIYIHNPLIKPKLVGYCGLDKIDSVNRTAEMGLLIDPEHHGKGYGSVVVRKLLKMAFEQFNLNCIFIEVIGSTNNWDFWLKQGFFHEGLLRARYYKNGVYYQSRVGSILKSEWSKANGN
jgi:RimJ/RimL family protein N-acetyltransferase